MPSSENPSLSVRDRAAGGLAALVAGDAIGLDARDRRPPGAGSDLAPRGPWSLNAALALASAASLAERGWDPDDLMDRFWRCWDRGEETADGRVLAAGPTTRRAILRFGSGAPVLEAGIDEPDATGCGALPRIFPVALHAAAEDVEEALLRCRDAASLTHAHDRVTDACAAYGLILRGLVEGAPLTVAVEAAAGRLRGWMPDADRDRLREAADGGGIDAEPAPDEPADAALLAGVRCAAGAGADVEAAVATAARRRGRAEVVAALAGSLAGVRAGLAGLPPEWLDGIPASDRVRDRARTFGERVAERLDG